jgi:hypothetical protein
MQVTFNAEDRALVENRLREAGVSIDDTRIKNVLYNVKASFTQQLEAEVMYMINEFEADN